MADAQGLEPAFRRVSPQKERGLGFSIHHRCDMFVPSRRLFSLENFTLTLYD